MSQSTTELVWPWRTRQEPVDTPPSRKGPWIQFVVMASVGLLFYFVLGHAIMAYVLWGISTLLLSGILFFDRVLHGFEVTGKWLAHGIGTGVTWILLVPFFYIVFGTGRFFLKLRGKDPMRRKLDPEAESYWTPHQKLDIETRYHRQF